MRRYSSPACFGVSGKPFSPWSLDSHLGNSPPKMESRMFSKCLPPRTLQYLADFHAILFPFASASLLRFGTQPERGWADGVAPGTSEHPYYPSLPTRRVHLGVTRERRGALYRTFIGLSVECLQRLDFQTHLSILKH